MPADQACYGVPLGSPVSPSSHSLNSHSVALPSLLAHASISSASAARENCFVFTSAATYQPPIYGQMPPLEYWYGSFESHFSKYECQSLSFLVMGGYRHLHGYGC